jgi:hypothetical protein
MGERGYLLVRVPRRHVPGWLWRLSTLWTPAARALSVHDAAQCECLCHEMAGMRECPWCGPVAHKLEETT